MKRVLLIDNYDSFTYNLEHYIEKFDVDCDVVRYNQLGSVDFDLYTHILISPGPGLPSDYPELFSILKKYDSSKSFLGVCLGIQCMVEHYGGQLENLDEVLHGVAGPIMIKDADCPIFADILSPFDAAHYHSWIPSRENFPENQLYITAVDNRNRIMGVRHVNKPVYGVQFHPESILSEYGSEMIDNWLNHQVTPS